MAARMNAQPLAFLGSIGAGASICAIQFVALMVIRSLEYPHPTTGLVLSSLVLGLISWFFAAVGFFVGLLFVGVPAWAAFVRLGWTSRPAAVVAGAVLAALAAGAGATLLGTGLRDALPSAAFLLLPGAAAGWTIHRIAYGPSPRP